MHPERQGSGGPLSEEHAFDLASEGEGEQERSADVVEGGLESTSGLDTEFNAAAVEAAEADEALQRAEATLTELGTSAEPALVHEVTGLRERAAQAAERFVEIQRAFGSAEDDREVNAAVHAGGAPDDSPVSAVPAEPHNLVGDLVLDSVSSGTEATPSGREPSAREQVLLSSLGAEDRRRYEQLSASVDSSLDGIVSAQSDLELSERMTQLGDLLGKVRGGQARDVLGALLDRVGVTPLERARQMFSSGRAERPDRSSAHHAYDSTSTRALGGLVDLLDRNAPELFDAYGASLLEAAAEKYVGRTAEDIRRGLASRLENAPVYSALEPVYRRLARGQPLSEQLRGAVRAILPVLEASDHAAEGEPRGERGQSRFLTDEFIARAERFTAADEQRGLGFELPPDRSGVGRFDAKKYAEVVRKALAEIRGS